MRDENEIENIRLVQRASVCAVYAVYAVYAVGALASQLDLDGEW